jgi:hypothetical protein
MKLGDLFKKKHSCDWVYNIVAFRDTFKLGCILNKRMCIECKKIEIYARTCSGFPFYVQWLTEQQLKSILHTNNTSNKINIELSQDRKNLLSSEELEELNSNKLRD